MNETELIKLNLFNLFAQNDRNIKKKVRKLKYGKLERKIEEAKYIFNCKKTKVVLLN